MFGISEEKDRALKESRTNQSNRFSHAHIVLTYEGHEIITLKVLSILILHCHFVFQKIKFFASKVILIRRRHL